MVAVELGLPAQPTLRSAIVQLLGVLPSSQDHGQILNHYKSKPYQHRLAQFMAAGTMSHSTVHGQVAANIAEMKFKAQAQEALNLAAESVNGVANLKDQLEKIKNSV